MDYNKSMQFPTNDNFANRITEAEFVESKKGSMMIHYTAEVVVPDTAQIDGREVNIAGAVTEQYLVTHVYKQGNVLDEEKTEQARIRAREFFTRCKQDADNIDWDNPNITWMKGTIVLTGMSCDVEPMYKDPTPEQKEKGLKGDVMTNPITGAKKVFYKPKIVEVWGLAPENITAGVAAGKPY